MKRVRPLLNKALDQTNHDLCASAAAVELFSILRQYNVGASDIVFGIRNAKVSEQSAFDTMATGHSVGSGCTDAE